LKLLQSNLLLRENVDLTFLRLSRRFDELGEQTQRIMTALLETQGKSYPENRIEFQDQATAVTQLLNRIETVILEEYQKTRAMLVSNSIDGKFSGPKCQPKIGGPRSKKRKRNR
jgi:hypothetical protein